MTQNQRKDWRWAIPELLEKNDGKCCVCNEQIISTTGAYVWIEHIVPLALGGKDEYDNLSVSHPRCNRVKKDRMPNDPELNALIPKLKAIAHQTPRERECLQCGKSIAEKGYSAYLCDPCTQERHRAYNQKYNQEYRENNPEKIKKQNATYYQTNKETILERTKKNNKAYRDKNKDKINARKRAWRKANRDKENASKRKWREKQKTKSKQTQTPVPQQLKIQYNAPTPKEPRPKSTPPP